MNVIEWTSDFALGIDEIDEQHRVLVSMINALDARTHGDPGPERTRRLLAQLSDYVRDHFGLEERLMGGGGCSPDLIARHFAEHAHFRSVLRELTIDFEKGRRDVTRPLIAYLVDWFLHHIVVVDRAMTHQLDAAEPDLAARLATVRLQHLADELPEAERRLLAERLSQEQAARRAAN